MKKVLLSFTAITMTIISYSQSGEKWSFGLNSPSGNAALGTNNNFPLVIKTFGTEKMRITENGNVGIGTANPSDKLQVAGTARMMDATVDNQLQALSVIAQTANFTTAVVTGNFSAGSLTVNGNATINGNLSTLGGLTTDNIISLSGNIDFGNNNLSTTGNINSANISALQTTDSIFNSQFSILNSQVNSIQSSQWTTTQNGIEHNGNVFVKNLSVEESINIGSFRFSNGSKDTAIAPPPVIKDTIASDKPIVISAEKSISLNADTVLLGNGTGKVGIGPPLPSPSNEKLSVVGDVGVSGNLKITPLYYCGGGNPWTTNGNGNLNPATDFIGTCDAQDLIFKTDNQERMRIIPTGQIGIGTNPNTLSNTQGNYRLDINGDMRIITAGSTSPGAGGNVVIKTDFGGQGGEAEAKIGIGTENPVRSLHIYTTHTPEMPPFCPTCPISLAGSHNGMRLEDLSGTANPVRTIWDITPFNGSLLFSKGDLNNPSNLDVKIAVMSNGNVGIGTGNPQEKLDVNGSINATNFLKGGQPFAGEWQTNVNDIYNTNSGNVGIGITTPQAKLHIFDGSILMSGNPPDLWTTSHWRPILKAPLGSVWRTTEKGMGNLYYLGFGMTTTGWYWSAASTADDSGDPWYPMSLTDGTPPTGWVLTVDGRIVTKVLDVTPDYVYKKDYPLLTVEQLKAFIDKEGHHPNFLSAKQYEQRGKYDLLEMDMNLLKTSEELTLYIIELKKMLDEQNKVIDGMKKEIEKLKRGK